MFEFVWEPVFSRENGSLLYEHEIAHYTLYIDNEIYDYPIHTTYRLKKKKGCHEYYVTVTDTDNIESKKSNKLCVCNKGRGV